jgi:hypothetical protein
MIVDPLNFDAAELLVSDVGTSVSDHTFLLAVSLCLGIFCVLSIAAVFASKWEAEERAKLPPASTDI